MKAAILYNDRDIRAGIVPDPVPGPDEVLVKPAFAGICGTDLHIYRGEFRERVRYPAIQGHEFGGTIVEIGKNVRHLRTGERVVVDPIISCHACRPCLTGHINACQSLKLIGVDLPGGYGQLVAVPAGHILRLPDAIPMMYAPMVELYGIAHHVLHRGQVQLGETVVILGSGKVGLSIIDVLSHGSKTNLIVCTDQHETRLATAKKLGADHAVNIMQRDPVALVKEVTGGAGADCVIEAVGHYSLAPGQAAPLEQAVQMIRNGGRIVTLGLGDHPSTVNFKTLVLKEATLIASRVTLGEFPQAARLMEKQLLHPEILVTHRMEIGEVKEAFAEADRERGETLKIVLDIQAG